MTNLLKIFVGLVIIGLVAYAGVYLTLVSLGDYLTPTDKLQKADAIVVFSGEADRTAWGIKLYQDGWAPKIVFSGAALDKSGPSNASTMRQIALSAGIPDQAILLDEKSNNTFENAQNSKQILDSVDAKKVILVTSPYHQRRSFETLKQVYSTQPIDIINSPSGYSTWSAQTWWEKTSSADVALSEFMKIIWAKLTGQYS